MKRLDGYAQKCQIFACANPRNSQGPAAETCNTHFTLADWIISKDFKSNSGVAYLFKDACNVKFGPALERCMITGKHVVKDVYCMTCNKLIGWHYVHAYEPSQKYKEGKYVLELALITDIITPYTPSPLETLPFELAQEIAVYLPPQHVWTLASVSRRCQSYWQFYDSPLFAQRNLAHLSRFTEFSWLPHVDLLEQSDFHLMPDTVIIEVLKTRSFAHPIFAGWKIESMLAAETMQLRVLKIRPAKRTGDYKLFRALMAALQSATLVESTSKSDMGISMTTASDLLSGVDDIQSAVSQISINDPFPTFTPSTPATVDHSIEGLARMIFLGFAATGESPDLFEILQTVKEPHWFTDNAALEVSSYNGHAAVVSLLLSLPVGRVDPAAIDNKALRSGVDMGHLAVVKALVSDDRVDASARENEAVRHAAEYGHVDVLRVLLESGKVDASAMENYAIECAARNRHYDIVVLLMACDSVDSYAVSNAVTYAAENGHADMVKTILDKGSAKVTQEAFTESLRRAVEWGYVDVVRVLLSNPGLNPASLSNEAIRCAARTGRAEVVATLLTSPQVDPTVLNNEALRSACKAGHIDVVRTLLADARVDAGDLNSEALRLAAANGHTKIVYELLKCNRVDPAACESEALRIAARNGCANVLYALLEDGRCDAGSRDSEALRVASEYGHIECVKILVKTRGVVASARNNEAIRLAARGRHNEVVKILMAFSGLK